MEEDGENQTLGVSKELYNKGQYHKESLLSHYVSRSKLMGKRVTLRCIEKTDISHIWRWAGKNPVINKLGLPIPIAKEEIIEWVNSQVNEDPNDRALYTIEQEDNIPIGLCGLFKIENSSRRAEYFILIGDPDFLGHDYGAEATHLMLDLAFNLLNLNRLESFILDEDERAMHSFSKNSFKKEGLLYEYTYLNGEYKNVLVLSILKSEYEEFMR
jgi:RimJ/RimL family protein N-acetyltransferase